MNYTKAGLTGCNPVHSVVYDSITTDDFGFVYVMANHEVISSNFIYSDEYHSNNNIWDQFLSISIYSEHNLQNTLATVYFNTGCRKEPQIQISASGNIYCLFGANIIFPQCIIELPPFTQVLTISLLRDAIGDQPVDDCLKIVQSYLCINSAFDKSDNANHDYTSHEGKRHDINLYAFTASNGTIGIRDNISEITSIAMDVTRRYLYAFFSISELHFRSAPPHYNQHTVFSTKVDYWDTQNIQTFVSSEFDSDSSLRISRQQQHVYIDKQVCNDSCTHSGIANLFRYIPEHKYEYQFEFSKLNNKYILTRNLISTRSGLATSDEKNTNEIQQQQQQQQCVLSQRILLPMATQKILEQVKSKQVLYSCMGPDEIETKDKWSNSYLQMDMRKNIPKWMYFSDINGTLYAFNLETGHLFYSGFAFQFRRRTVEKTQAIHDNTLEALERERAEYKLAVSKDGQYVFSFHSITHARKRWIIKELKRLDECSTCSYYSEVKICNRCKVQVYCSKSCQVDDWKDHEEACSRLT